MQVSTEVPVLFAVWADPGSVENFVGVSSEDTPTEVGANMFRDSNNVANTFRGIGGKISLRA